MKVSVLYDAYLMLVLGVLKNSPNPGRLTWIKPSNHVMLLNPKHVSNIPSYVAIINSILPNRLKKRNSKPRQDED